MANYPNGAAAAKFNCGLYLVADEVSAFDPGGFSIALWIMWRDPTFLDPCFVDNPGENPYFTSSRNSAWVFAYNDYQDPGQTDGARLTLSVPSGLKLWNSGASIDFGCAIDDGQWHFLAFAMVPADPQHDKVTVWLDGKLKNQALLYHDQGFATPNGKRLGIGCEYSSGSEDNRYVGGMGEFQIWRGALTADKIAALMLAPPVPAKEPDLRVLIPLRQASVSDGQVYDVVGSHCGRISVYK